MTKKTNFDFLKTSDSKLFEIIEDAQRLFLDEYFNQCVVQIRIFAEKIAKKILGSTKPEMTFDDIINCLKDKVQNEAQKEFIDDLFFIKKEGNKCAHGEDSTAIEALETLERAFEIALSYVKIKDKTDKFDNLIFDKTLLITGKPKEDIPLIEKYLKRAQSELDKDEKDKEALLNLKQGEFNSKVEKSEEGFKDKNRIVDIGQYKDESTKKRGRKKKILTKEEQETKDRIKKRVKEAKKTISQNINKVEKPKKTSKKQNLNSKIDWNFIKALAFVLFLICCIALLSKMIFVF